MRGNPSRDLVFTVKGTVVGKQFKSFPYFDSLVILDGGVLEGVHTNIKKGHGAFVKLCPV
jgi:hypothetical protein